MAADVDDVEHLLVLHGADLHAGAAGGAGPDRFLVDGEFQQGVLGRRAALEGGGFQREGTGVSGDHVQLHALVDFQRGGAQGLAGRVGRADVLAAVALDAGVSVEQARPFQVLEFLGTQSGFVGLHGLFQTLHGGQDAATDGPLEGVVQRGHEDVNVLGEREVRQERQDAAERAPVPEDAPALDGLLAGAVKQQAAQGAAERLEGVVPAEFAGFLGHLGSVAEHAAAHVEGDERRDDQAVAQDVVGPQQRVQQRLVGEAEVAFAGQEQAADQQADDPHEDQHAEQVGQEVVPGEQRAVLGVDVEGNVPFEAIHDVDQQVVHEAVEDEAVQHADGGAAAEGALLGEADPDGVQHALDGVPGAVLAGGGAARHAAVQTVEAPQAEAAGDQGEDEEQHLVDQGQQGATPSGRKRDGRKLVPSQSMRKV